MAPVCWQVGGGQPNNIVYTLSVKVRDMLAGRTVGGDAPVAPDTGSAGAGGADGSDGSTDPNVPTGAPGACVATTPATAPQTLTLYFMLVDGGKNSVGMATWKLTYKLTSAPPPDHVQADVGENIAPISWSYDSNQSDPYTAGYQFFCDPGPGQSGLDEAGIMPEPGIIPICQHSVILQPGTRPEDKYKCGTAERTATKGNATGLFNNVAYNVAVATTDTYLNVGNISEPTCAVPQPVTGFFEAYRGAGGLGGGGFCSFSRRGDPAVLLAVLGLGSCLLLRRRRAT